MARFRTTSIRTLVALAVLAAMAVAGGIWGLAFVRHRFTHSVSMDAFIESHLVNLSPQVAGEIVTMFVQEQELVKKGQVIAIVDPLIYEREVDLANAKLSVAKAALAKSEADLTLLEAQVPQQIAVAEAAVATANDNVAKAEAAVVMVTQDVDDAVIAAQRAVEAKEASLVMAKEDFARYENLYQDGSVTQRRFQEATKVRDVAAAERKVADAKLGQAEANRNQIEIAKKELAARQSLMREAEAALQLAKIGNTQIKVVEKVVAERKQDITEADKALELAKTNLGYTKVVAPYDGVIAKKFRHLGDYAHTGDPIVSMYNPDFLYATVHLEETRLEGVNPGNWANLQLEAYSEQFRGRVVWIGSATGANFSLIPRDLASGEFTYVVQRVPVRLAIVRDQRWAKLKPGLSVTVEIEHGPGDAEWAAKAWQQEAVEADVERGGR
jgi:membrane fusion protein, multidrug efflux system